MSLSFMATSIFFPGEIPSRVFATGPEATNMPTLAALTDVSWPPGEYGWGFRLGFTLSTVTYNVVPPVMCVG